MLSLLTIGGSVIQPIREMNDLALHWRSHFSSKQPVRVRFLYPEYGTKVNLAKHRVRLQRVPPGRRIWAIWQLLESMGGEGLVHRARFACFTNATFANITNT
jgi:hypothetical protein